MEAEGGSEKRHFMNLLDEYMYEREHLAYTYEDVGPMHFLVVFFMCRWNHNSILNDDGRQSSQKRIERSGMLSSL